MNFNQIQSSFTLQLIYACFAKILLIILLLTHYQNCSPNNGGSESNPGTGTPPISLINPTTSPPQSKHSNTECIFYVFFESLCPFSIEFIKQLGPYIQSFINCCTVKMISYGNQNGDTCQHGPNECFFNRLIQCIFAHTPDESISMEMMMCIINNATKNPDDPTTTASQCCKESNMDCEILLNCVNGDEGDKLQSVYAYYTHKAGIRGVPDTRYGPDMRSDPAMNNLMRSNVKEGICMLNSNCSMCGIKE